VFIVFIENRTDKVKISLLVDGVAIKDDAGNVWNEKIINYSLRAQNSDSELPYITDFFGETAITWKGEMASGQLSDGEHTLTLKVLDNETSPNQAPDLDMDGDNKVDTSVEVTIGGLNAHTIGSPALYDNFKGIYTINPSTLERNQTISFSNENVGIASIRIDGPQGVIWNPTFDPPVSSTVAVLTDLPVGDYTAQSFSAVGAETKTPFTRNHLVSSVV